MQEYELMYVINGDLDEAGVTTASERVAASIANRGGEITDTDSWGRRRLAYPIDHHLEGVYTVLRIKINSDALTTVERDLKLNEAVIRHLLSRPGN